MFKKTLLAAAVSVMALGSVSAMAADAGLITFDGAVTDGTCTITTNNGVDANNVTITLPVVKAKDVQDTTIDTGVGEKIFGLHLSGCPSTVTQASATFTSMQFANVANGTLNADTTQPGYAKNVSLALYNASTSSSDRIMIGQPANNTQIAPIDETTGTGDLTYRVAYVPTSTTGTVSGGSVSSNVTFTMSYN